MFNILERGLTPQEHFRQYGRLEGRQAEELLDQYQLLLNVKNWAELVLPACQWTLEYMTTADRRCVLGLEAALLTAKRV